MPKIGNVEVSDDVIQSLQRGAAAEAPAARPGWGDQISAAAQGAYGQVRYGLPYQAERLAGTLTGSREAEYKRGLAAAGAAAGAAPPASLAELTSGKVGFARFVGENLVASLPSMAGSVVGGAAGFARGGRAGAVAGAILGGIPQFSASNVSRAVEEQGGLTEDAAVRALATAPVQSAADAAVARFLPGAGHVIGDLAATQSGNFLRRTATSILKAGGTEAVTEAAQQFGERYAAGIPVGNADAAGEYVNAAVTAFAVGGVLGAGGGFRRTNAIAKAPDAVTNDDMTTHIDGMLNGTLRALPAPSDFIVGPDGETRINPSGRTQLALPSPESFGRTIASDGRGAVNEVTGAPLLVDAEGIASTDPTALAAQPRAVSEGDTRLELDPFEAAIPQAQLALPAPAQPGGPQIGTGTPILVDAAGRASENQTALLEAPRRSADPFEGVQDATLEEAAASPQATPEARTAIRDEIARRKVVKDDPFKGVPMNQDIVKLRNASPDERLAGVTTLLENGDSRVGTLKLAANLGIDLNAPAAPLAETSLDARPGNLEAPAPVQEQIAPEAAIPEAPAPVRVQPVADPEFASQWNELKTKAGIQRLRGGQSSLDVTPANLEAAQAQVFSALATDASNAEVSQVEKLARTMGLVTDDDAMDVTPKGRQAFLSTPEGNQEVQLASREQGYTDAQATVFDRGVRAALNGEAAPALGNFDDMAAFQAGQVWARDFVENADTRTAAQTNAIRARQGARETLGPTPEARREMSPGQVQQRALNNLIDTVDLSDVADQERVELRRLVASGATPTEVGQAIQRLQGGESIRQVPPRPVERPLIGGRGGQPRFKEMNTPDRVAQKSEQRAETDQAVRAYDVRGLIEFAKAEGGITEGRAQKLHDLLDRGNVDQVRASLSAFDPDAKPKPAAKRLPTPPETVDTPSPEGIATGAPDAKFEAAIDGKDLDGILDHMISAAPSKYHREIMRKVKSLADKLRKNGVTIDIQVVRPGDTAPVVLNREGTRAFTVSKLKPPSSQIYLKASEMGATSGMNYQLVAHELLHAVTDRLVNYGLKNPNTDLGKTAKDLRDLGNAIVSHFNQRLADGKLNDFEQAYYRRQNNSLADVHEIISWGLTNPDMQRYLQSIEYKPRQSVFGRVVELLRNLLGLDGKYDTALTELLRVSEKVMSAGQPDLLSAYAMNNPEGFDTGVISSPATAAPARSAPQADVQAKTVIEQAQALYEQATSSDTVSSLKDNIRKFGLGFQSRNHLDVTYGGMVPGVLENTRARETRQATRNVFQLVGENVAQEIDKLNQSSKAQDKKDYKRINDLMLASQYGIDGARTWEQHEHLQEDPNADNLKAMWEEAWKNYNDLARHGTAGLFEEARAANMAQNYGHMIGQLYERIASDEQYKLGVPGSDINPADTLINTEGLTTAAAMRDHLVADLDQRIAAAKTFLETQSTSAASLSAKDRSAIEARNAPLDVMINDIAKSRLAMARQPYFHLPRFGDHFAAFTIAKDKDGNVDKAKLRRVAEELQALGIEDVQLSTDNTNPRVMIRTENRSTAELMGQLGKRLEGLGVVEQGTTLSGPRTREDNFGLGNRVPDYIAQALERLDTDPAFAPDSNMSAGDKERMRDQLAAAKQALVDGWLDLQPDNSLSKVLSKRRNVQGASTDMIRGFAHRQNVGAIGISALMTRPKFTEAVRSMRATVEESVQKDNELDPYVVSQVVREVRRRDADNPINEIADGLDKLRAAANTSFLGLNPSTSIINMTALGTTVLPELAKKFGYGKSFHAMRRAGVQAGSILKAAFEDAQQRGGKHRADLSLTENVIAKANIPPEAREFIRKRVAAGDIDLATMSRALGQLAGGKSDTKFDTALRYGSAFNLYSESFARLTATLAARELHGGGNSDEAHAYARSVVKESLMSFAPGDTGRLLGKNGILGPVTPIVTQFMQWSIQVTEKLFREFKDATGGKRAGETDEGAKTRRSASQKWMAGHLSAITAISGTLGLPFATVFAAVAERLFGDDDDPFDATAEYRDFLASVLGKDVGEVVARGLPRAAGFDISRRAGEADLLPFSDVLADKRSWTEALQDQTGKNLGAAPSMVLSMLDGGSKILGGDFLEGAKMVLPTALKNPLEAYRMADEGYIDTKGNKLPLTPGAADILWQLIGFAPSDKAEYNEAKRDQQARRSDLTRRSRQLRTQITRAIEQGDRSTARDLINEAMDFDANNPAFAVVPSLVSSMQRSQVGAARAQALGTPVGVAANDLQGQALTRYANY